MVSARAIVVKDSEAITIAPPSNPSLFIALIPLLHLDGRQLAAKTQSQPTQHVVCGGVCYSNLQSNTDGSAVHKSASVLSHQRIRKEAAHRCPQRNAPSGEPATYLVRTPETSSIPRPLLLYVTGVAEVLLLACPHKRRQEGKIDMKRSLFGMAMLGSVREMFSTDTLSIG